MRRIRPGGSAVLQGSVTSLLRGPLLLTIGLVALLTATAEGSPKTSARPASPPPAAAPAAPRPAPAYDGQMLRLARIVGSVDYLRQLCSQSDPTDWRAKMQALIDADADGDEARRKRLTAAFNRGYRSFASVYVTCTETAVTAERQYRREGATLAREIAAKYGN